MEWDAYLWYVTYIPYCSALADRRAFKAVEATLTELQCPVALYGPRVMTRSTSGAWLALRSEVIGLHEIRRNLANRLNADDRAVRRPEKRRVR